MPLTTGDLGANLVVRGHVGHLPGGRVRLHALETAGTVLPKRDVYSAGPNVLKLFPEVSYEWL
jgi:hypothetical protein